MSALLNVQGLKSGYGVVEVLRGVDLQVMPGELVALLGSNGAGKTTLNLTLSGLVARVRARWGLTGRTSPVCIRARWSSTV
jgi:branched-chain amino acid transport system ATP-binding protein